MEEALQTPPRAERESAEDGKRDGKESNGEEKEVKIVSWNVNSLRAFVKRLGEDKITTFFSNYDVICLQETKLSEDQVDEFLKDLGDPDLEGYFCCCETKKGYSGVVIFTRITPKNVVLSLPGVQRKEGRYIEVDLGALIIINVYIPNSGGGPERLKFKMEFCDLLLDRIEYLGGKEGKNVILCGDFNVAPGPMDVFHPYDVAIGLPGFLPEEREWLSKVKKAGYMDAFRYFNPDVEETYTVWDMKTFRRARNEGWRIDLFMVKRSLLPPSMAMHADEIDLHVATSRIFPEILGSDHCPLDLVVKGRSSMFCSKGDIPSSCAKFLSQFSSKGQGKIHGNTPSITSFFAPISVSGNTGSKGIVKIGLKRERERKTGNRK
eukprot:TRINITY_DN39802_c0_g1_i2.p1 TRINITY_DN39802_c0_g1~~TRINITY_DN39802_c0_g1_i2.p1  ORF type:complete len:378 (+),score=86.80 TRINITY_DN39802_c0_g1_i2:127-1260(+)